MGRRTIPLIVVGGLIALVATISLALAVKSSSPPAAGVASSAAVGADGAATPGSPTGAALSTFDDPFVYCGQVGDMLHSDSRYTGPAVPDSVVRALERALQSGTGALDTFVRAGAVYWRCQAGQVFGCVPGANLQCWEADTKKTPTPGEQSWCGQHPGDFSAAALIPAHVTGHTTIYEWRCNGTSPTIFRQSVDVDAAGLNRRIWYQLAP